MSITSDLLTIANFAELHKVTTSYIYKLIGENRLAPTWIDGVKFIDKSKYTKLDEV